MPANWSERFKKFFLNNRFVLFLFILLLLGLNVMVLMHISFIFEPFVVLLKTIILPIILAGIAFYLLNPVVDLMERYRIRRIYSICALFLFIAGLITLLIVAVLPLIQEQVMDIAQKFPSYVNQLSQELTGLWYSPIFLDVKETLNIDLQSIAMRFSNWATDFLDNATQRVFSVVGAVTEVVLAIITLPFILFYLLKDGKKLPGYFVHFLPVRLRGKSLEVLGDINHQISSYIRGQIIVSFCIGVLLYIGYLIIGLDYSLTLAVMAAFTSVVPYVGPAIAITPALIIALVTSPIMLLKMIAVWTIVQLIEGKFISPQIMGKNLHVHPITIIFVILTAGNLFGIVGILVAVPGYAVLKVICTYAFQWIKERSKLYEESSQIRKK
ncbi:AI-2E family transporter [Aureibacillus halotolerans]|uniref:Putative PurR-regulated permease PerM n=1 Tax=Aureibacillus halotolerans TaxID=1508390 RepID=A0A4R6U2J7_9BACI|nr:AI-2E family transporter [Aureibacillus halotolerans]TDQ38659.1 putative PurR-regulated permease PerM [Aureibacillus halotolerans]